MANDNDYPPVPLHMIPDLDGLTEQEKHELSNAIEMDGQGGRKALWEFIRKERAKQN